MKRKPSPKAFTLAELLTLFVVIGFFAAVLAPVAEQSRRSASRTADRDKIRRIAEAALIYGSDNEGNLPQNNLDGIGKLDRRSFRDYSECDAICRRTGARRRAQRRRRLEVSE